MTEKSKCILRPIDEAKNQSVFGFALCGESIFEERLAEIKQLRETQKAYNASLPNDPHGAVREIFSLLHDDNCGSYPEGFEEALYLSASLGPMIRMLGLSEPGADQEAILYIADKIQFGLERARQRIDRANDIAASVKRSGRNEAEP